MNFQLALHVVTTYTETIYGIWNAVAGGSSSPASPGTTAGCYVPAESPPNAFDGNPATKYLSFGNCNIATVSTSCGVGTGFYFTAQNGISLLRGVRLCTANDAPNRDPMTMTIEGSNQPSSTLTSGSSWTLIYSGPTGLNTDPGRFTWGVQRNFTNNVWYASYRVLITSIRGADCATQYMEVNLIGN